MRRYSPPPGYVLVRLPEATNHRPKRRSKSRAGRRAGLVRLAVFCLATGSILGLTLLIVLIANFVR